jgi:hypothetical protein
MVALGLGTVALAVGPSLVDGGSDNPRAGTSSTGERSDVTASRDGERAPASRDGDPAGSNRSPRTPSESPSAAPSATTTGAPTRRATRPGGSSSAGPALPSTSPSQPPGAPSPEPEDLTPPQTSLSAAYPTGDAARFTLGADGSASFTCSLDGAAYAPCGSPTVLSTLDPGWHTFAVRATDAAGNVDPSPAEERWLATKRQSGDARK